MENGSPGRRERSEENAENKVIGRLMTNVKKKKKMSEDHDGLD